MKLIQKFSIVELPKLYPMGEYKRRLVIDGNESKTIINGDEIAFQYSVDKHYLVVTSYDYFEGVSYWFYLFDENGRLLDLVSTPDYFGFIQWGNIDLPMEAKFSFYGANDNWTITINEVGYWSYRKIHLLVRMNNFFLSKRYVTLTVEKDISPSWNSESKED